ncbi:hypothetical protein [Bradyrhizobium uaiense]|nr:hypothetical protein [Bradyrhizobium uaiense]
MLPESRAALLVMAGRYRVAVARLEQRNAFANTMDFGADQIFI